MAKGADELQSWHCRPPAWCGVDMSALATQDAEGAAPPFRATVGGEKVDALVLLKARGGNAFRMRLWHDPCASGECDKARFSYANLTNVLRMARRVWAANLSFILDLHYSDWWADPDHQRKPAEWRRLPFAALRHAVRSYTRQTVGVSRRTKLQLRL